MSGAVATAARAAEGGCRSCSSERARISCGCVCVSSLMNSSQISRAAEVLGKWLKIANIDKGQLKENWIQNELQ